MCKVEIFIEIEHNKFEEGKTCRLNTMNNAFGNLHTVDSSGNLYFWHQLVSDMCPDDMLPKDNHTIV